jgi:hypothetical protein
MRVPSIVALPVLACVAAACADAPTTTRSSSLSPTGVAMQNAVANGVLSEPAAYNGRICKLQFPGATSPNTDIYAIWNLGNHGILDVPFDTDRPDLYAILPGTMHTDPAHPQLNHDHIVSAAPGVPGYDGTWDVWVVEPGPNFDAATYVAPRSVESMVALIQQGVLGEPVGFSQTPLGVPDLVLRAPFVCTGGQ